MMGTNLERTKDNVCEVDIGIYTRMLIIGNIHMSIPLCFGFETIIQC